jgi:hypothetical protein
MRTTNINTGIGQDIKRTVLPNDVLLPQLIALTDEGHTVTLLVKGISMRPYVEGGRDKALLASIGNPQVGDIALAEIEKGRYVLHRIVKINGDNVTLRGDGNIGCEHCKLADVRCKALGFYRKGREKLDSTSSLTWKIYSWLWTHLFPIRRYILFIHRKLFVRKVYQ